MLRYLRLLAALLLAGSCVVLTTVPAHAACSCRGATTQSHTKNAQAVFTGTVTAAVSTRKSGGQQGATFTHHVTVDRVYKGDIASVDVQVATDSATRSNCGLGKLTADKRYMFFVRGGSDVWTAESCGGTAPASAKLVSQVERLLGNGRPATPPEPQRAVFTNVSDGEPATLARAAAPGVALVLVGLLGLIVVRRVGRRSQ
ncbi:MAG: hypothetical protein JWO11_971 [Nocardioides sp.]|nr:hypothetical protein [Nocardioides sp.]